MLNTGLNFSGYWKGQFSLMPGISGALEKTLHVKEQNSGLINSTEILRLVQEQVSDSILNSL